MYRKRLIALAAALLLMTVGVVVYFIVHGSTYTEDLEWMDDPKMTEDDLSVEVDNENIVRADRVYLNEDRKFCVDFHSVGGGTTAVTYFVKDRFTYKTELFVNEFGTIIAKDSLNFDGYVQVEILMIVGLALILLVMLSCFIESWIKARFSYSMVGYGGVALFSASVITVVIYGMQWMNTFARFLNNIMETGFLFAFFQTIQDFIYALDLVYAGDLYHAEIAQIEVLRGGQAVDCILGDQHCRMILLRQRLKPRREIYRI